MDSTERAPIAGAIVFLFFGACMVTGFYTMVIYAISTVYNWQKIICPIAWQQ